MLVDCQDILPQIQNYKSMREIHRRIGGSIDGSYWFAMILRRNKPPHSITLKPKMVRVVDSFLYNNIGEESPNDIEYPGVVVHESGEWHRKMCVTHQVLSPY